MNFHTVFQQIMQNQTEIALATSVDGVPNVRIVTFYFNPKNNILYFATFKENDKVREIASNDSISITTIPKKGEEHVRIKHGIAKKSLVSIYDFQDAFVQKVPAYAEIIKTAGPMLDLYEVLCDQVLVVLDPERSQEIFLSECTFS